MASKYPPTERTTSGKLVLGDNLLIRERGSDTLWQRRVEGLDYQSVPPGRYELVSFESYLSGGGGYGRRASRYYLLDLRSVTTGERFTADVSAVNRVNRVVS